ncbi:hypothetical protein [Haliangium ochraceum]|nr:hypothetical protein [Haliangium ochraceum]
MLMSSTAWAQGDEAAAPEVVESGAAVPGWFRVDLDSLGPQFWFGATHQVGGIALASDIYLAGTYAELDVGVALSFGNLSLTPMVGLGVDFGAQSFATIAAPQLYTIFAQGDIYFESWIQGFFSSPFSEGVQDYLHTRNFLLYQVSTNLALGGQIEANINFNESTEGAGDDGLAYLPVGIRANIGYGENNTVGIFLGYDLQAPEGSDGIGGRFTFVRTW